MTRCGSIALVGRPNAGKSTLLNALVGEQLAIVSRKPQSTRQPTLGLLSDGDTQFQFTDAPGLLEPRDKLQHVMREAVLRVIATVDVVAYLHPLPEAPAPPLVEAARLDRPPRAPVLTVYTKADLVSPSRRPTLSADAIGVSAKTGEGLTELLDRCRAELPEGPFLYDPAEISTQPLRFFAAEFVREAAFEVLRDELPYAVHVEIEEFRESRDPVYIRAALYVERESQKGIVVGHRGRTIRAIGQGARRRIEALVGRPVYLDLWAKVLPKWRRRTTILKRLGLPA